MLSIAWKDLLVLFKDRNALIGAFVVPVAFIVVFLGVSGMAAGAGASGQTAAGTPLSVVNNDPAGATSQQLVANLGQRAGFAVAPIASEGEAQAQLEAQSIRYCLVIPAGFSANVEAGGSATLRLLSNTLDRGEREAARMTIEAVVRQMSLEREIVASLQRLGDMQAANPSFDPATSARLAIPIAQAQFETARDRPLITVVRSSPASLPQQQVEIGGVQIGVPGFTVLFIFLTAQITARSIYEEKKTGTFRRLLAAPLGNWRLLIGKLIPNFAVVLLQVVFLFAAGMFVLPLLGLDALRLGNDPVALVLLVLAAALCSTTLGVLIAAIARTEAQIGGISGVVLWVLAFLGGSFIPLFLLNDSMATIGQVTPHFWAVTGFYDLLTRGLGLAAIVDSLAALLAFSAAFFVIGAWRFEWD